MTVSRIEWSDEFKLGLPAIDAEHKDLLDVCNLFLEAVEAGQSVAALAQVLDNMILRTRAHFLAEERLLDRHGYPGLVAHRTEHERLLLQAEALKARYTDAAQAEEIANLTSETAHFLQTWLLDHIRTNDRPYRPFLMSLS
ncbi:bacteriohemerythrin [Magnetospirillum aberrantis]|uniref:Hemerythrin family protein n=1 Tax=Magnetospirillum aberrantis SpK TaxID=908842 RepID=A0A7C9USL6_9PROT|nr:bacteriohemerythrin [Magnetospirillum aberrantis]NFV79408.1 hemerythrin family protein [Magnetospirillum aberrantis SpK]